MEKVDAVPEAEDPSTIAQWDAVRLAEQLTKRLPEPLKAPVSANIIAKDVDGKKVLAMMNDLCTPGKTKALRDHETFKEIFGDAANEDMWRQLASKMAVRTPTAALQTFFSVLINENASVVVSAAQKRVFEIIKPTLRNYEFDAYFSASDFWCIASGQEQIVESCNGGGRHVEGFYVSPCGWQRLALKVVDDGSKNFTGEEWTHWHKGYHGTRGVAVESIAENGLLQPGAVVNGLQVKGLNGKAGAGGKSVIYASPCLEYSAHSLYTAAKAGGDDKAVVGEGVGIDAAKAEGGGADGPSSSMSLSWENAVAVGSTYAQFVFEVRVKPGTYRVQGNTLGAWPKRGKYAGPAPKTPFMPYDDCCVSENLEWIIEDARNVVCTGVLIRVLPCSITETTRLRKELMCKASDWSDGAGCRRPRNYGTPHGAPRGVAWEYNDAPKATLSYSDSQPWVRYSTETSAMIERAYQQYQRVCFIGTPPGAPGPYAVHFGSEWNAELKERPEQRRADSDKLQLYRRRAVRRVAL